MLRYLLSVFTIMMIGIAPARAAMEDYPSVKLQGLDKSTARTITFEAKVGSTITYGPLFIRVQSCRKAPPIEKPESAAFVQIWEVPPETGKSEWVFSGWMFASSPALSAMDHAVYDVWVLDCTGREDTSEQPPPDEEETATDRAASQDALEPVVDSEAAPAEEAVPLDSEAAGEPDPAVTPADPYAARPTEPPPGVPFDPAVDPSAPSPDTPMMVDPDAPYVPAPLPGQAAPGQPQPAPPVDYDAPYSPSRVYQTP